uniref:TIL domain-containing protein n=1 Tax=Steinernema glaseri TaxID=37863 RepID=A0A1I8A3G5_9BILA
MTQRCDEEWRVGGLNLAYVRLLTARSELVAFEGEGEDSLKVGEPVAIAHTFAFGVEGFFFGLRPANLFGCVAPLMLSSVIILLIFGARLVTSECVNSTLPEVSVQGCEWTEVITKEGCLSHELKCNETAVIDKRCILPPSKGSCLSTSTSFYFDVKTARCVPLIYGSHVENVKTSAVSCPQYVPLSVDSQHVGATKATLEIRTIPAFQKRNAPKFNLIRLLFDSPVESKKCGANETIKPCGACDSSCINPLTACDMVCRTPECGCRDGYVRDSKNRCILIGDCSVKGNKTQAFTANVANTRCL